MAAIDTLSAAIAERDEATKTAPANAIREKTCSMTTSLSARGRWRSDPVSPHWRGDIVDGHTICRGLPKGCQSAGRSLTEAEWQVTSLGVEGLAKRSGG